MSTSAAEYRRREQTRKERRLLLWLLGSAVAHGVALLLLLLWFLFSPQPPELEEPVEFTIVDPSDLAPADADLRADNNSVDAGENNPNEDPNAGGGSPVEGAQTQAPPPRPEPPQPAPEPAAPQQQAAAPAPPVEPEAPPEPAPPEPEPIPEQAEIAQAPPVPAPTPIPTPRPTPPPISTPAPQTRESSVDELAALPRPVTRQPVPPAQPAPTRESSASQLGGPISSNSASGLTNPSQSGPGQPGVAARADLDWGPYLARLQQRVERRWIPGQSNTSRRSIVVFTINKTGSVSNVRLAQTSGNQQTDAAALTAIQQAAPVEPLPAAFPGQSVDIHFTFDLNVAGGVFAQ